MGVPFVSFETMHEEISEEIKVELKPKFTLRRKLVDQVKNFIYDHVRKYA